MHIELIPHWKSLWRAASVQLIALGVLLPEILQLIQTNLDTLPWLDDGYKSGIRLACMILALVMRPVKQVAVSGTSPVEAPANDTHA